VKHLSALPRKVFTDCLVKTQRTSLFRFISSHKCRGLEIVEAGEADLDKVRRVFHLEVNTSPPDGEDAVNFVAKKEQRILGFAQLVRHPGGGTLDDGYYLFSLNVRLLCRGLGIGRGLVTEVMARAKAEGAPELRVFTYEDNRAALGLFHTLGFRVKAGEKRPLVQGRNPLILARALVD
jgi:ribosomal protein S18 acetylase RimI-like enzyme